MPYKTRCGTVTLRAVVAQAARAQEVLPRPEQPFKGVMKLGPTEFHHLASVRVAVAH